MAKKHFYESLIETSEISIELAELDLSPKERVHLLSLMEANIHSEVINTVLSELPKDDKKIFLKNLISNDHELIWLHLKSKSKDIDKKISTSVKKIKKELIKDIQKVKVNSRS